MAKRSGLVHDPKKAQSHMRPEIPAARHEQILASCEDVPEMEPVFRLALTKVGISSKTIWIRLPQGTLPFEAEIMVDLPAGFRGIHMSRIERAISTLTDERFDDIRSYSEKLCRLVLLGQRGTVAEIFLGGKLPQFTRTSLSNELSTDNLDISVLTKGKQAGEQVEVVSHLGLCITHITACPCTQAYNRALFPEAQIPWMPTHSQRCMTRLQVEDKKGNLTYHHLYHCLESCLHLSQDLLKRPDEAELVLKCHNEPQFVEDVIRLVAFQAGKRLSDLLPSDSRITIESTSLESIHLHNVKSRLRCQLHEIRGMEAPDDY